MIVRTPDIDPSRVLPADLSEKWAVVPRSAVSRDMMTAVLGVNFGVWLTSDLVAPVAFRIAGTTCFGVLLLLRLLERPAADCMRVLQVDHPEVSVPADDANHYRLRTSYNWVWTAAFIGLVAAAFSLVLIAATNSAPATAEIASAAIAFLVGIAVVIASLRQQWRWPLLVASLAIAASLCAGGFLLSRAGR